MKLLIAGVQEPQEKQVQFSLKRDENDIDIYADGELVAYFEVINGKIQLQLVQHIAHTSTFHMDPNEFILVRY